MRYWIANDCGNNNIINIYINILLLYMNKTYMRVIMIS